MASLIGRFLNHLALGPLERKVTEYLNAATCDSVASDLGKVLLPQRWRARGHLQVIFGQYCIQDSAGEKYWNEDSFRNHIRSAHPESIISDGAVRLLWRSFHFYAYHPFPRHPQQVTNLDFDAFHRAALLVVFQCDSLLGTRELDWFWRHDAAFFHNACFARVFRSLAVPETATIEQGKSVNQVNDVTPSLSDAMDVLVMVGPQFIHAMPSERQLETVARRLFISGPAAERGSARREDVSNLMELLLRLELNEEKWGSYYHYGHILQADPANEEFTEALVDALMGGENKQVMTPEQLLEATCLFPNLPLRFQQLWAVLFQPPMESPCSLPAASTHIREGVISLFLPRLSFEIDFRPREDNQDTRITFAEVLVSLDSSNLEMSSLNKALSLHSSDHVVLFTGDTESTRRAVMGVYLPAPSSVINYSLGHTWQRSSHVFFQLLPTFRLLWGTKSYARLADLINTRDKKTSPGDDMQIDNPKTLTVPYWIGDASGEGVRLKIDPEKRTVALTGGDAQLRTDLKTKRSNEVAEEDEVLIQNARMNLFTV
ncbi:hypothetical protein PFICI_10911 [Pestalotiopsis fici W106-1]|uniref:Uncharacterized protein n=1 Tax=Pestalotiopsis fici (strain W106-1 / CGMCC3.15140) TaxID=1229662 RepID=W3WV55_PESFW|nr:uncharacterized protein PFICI_10911 [Pestalotiopsis fici W106-1]ETS77037.1 hypothetical protein PFICI_10911 [Pestalotiopsis fici W106-1]